MASEFLCNLVVPGAAKSGTSTLHGALDQHPDVCMSSKKEPQFFSFAPRFRRGSAFHNRFFEHRATQRILGESSQCYFAHPHAMFRIANELDGVKAIIILRSPIDRLLSQFVWNFRRGTETASLEQAITTRGDSTDYVYDRRVRSYRELGGYLAFSRYSSWVPLWEQMLGRRNVLLLRFEDLASNPKWVLDRCFRFLGLEPVPIPFVAHKNVTSDTLARVLPGPVAWGAARLPSVVKASPGYERLALALRGWYTKTPVISMSPELSAFLDVELRPDMAMHAAVALSPNAERE